MLLYSSIGLTTVQIPPDYAFPSAERNRRGWGILGSENQLRNPSHRSDTYCMGSQRLFRMINLSIRAPTRCR